MRARLQFAVLVCLVLACSKKAVSPCDTAPLSLQIKERPVFVLCAAADVMAGASAIADSTFVQFWETYAPRELVERTDEAKLNAGILDLCELIDDLPAPQRAEAAAAIDSWIAASLALDEAESGAGGIEYFATAVAATPQLRSAVPKSAIERYPQDVGETMASAEFTAMDNALTHILSRMPAAERDSLLADVRARARAMERSEQ